MDKAIKGAETYYEAPKSHATDLATRLQIQTSPRVFSPSGVSLPPSGFSGLIWRFHFIPHAKKNEAIEHATAMN